MPLGAQPARPPAGLLALAEYQAGSPIVFEPAVFANPAIGGVALRANWADLEPMLGTFDWQPVDTVVAEAAASHRIVALILVPGFGTPAWALKGVASAMFARQYGEGTGQIGSLPLPWDGTYLSRWFTFLGAAAARYSANPAFRMIAAAGPSSVSVEMSLPNGPADISRWISLGYTPAKYEAAWQTTFEAYERIFPAQYRSLALYPGLPIGDNGGRDPAQRLATPGQVLAEGIADRSGFAVQTSGLTGSRTGSDLYDQVSSSSGVVDTGFQLQASATNNPGEMGDPSNPLHALALTLALGVAAHVDFLEVYQADVLNPAMQSLLMTTDTELLANAGQ